MRISDALDLNKPQAKKELVGFAKGFNVFSTIVTGVFSILIVMSVINKICKMAGFW